jgi:hypothetical protein
MEKKPWWQQAAVALIVGSVLVVAAMAAASFFGNPFDHSRGQTDNGLVAKQASPDAVGATATATPGVLTPEEAREAAEGAVIKLQDLPPGWVESEPPQDDGKDICGTRMIAERKRVARVQSMDYNNGTALISNVVAIYPSASVADEMVTAWTDALRRCDPDAVAAPISDTTYLVSQAQIGLLSFPLLADRTEAVRLTFLVSTSQNSFNIRRSWVFIRSGFMVALLSVGDSGDSGETTAEQIARIVADKLEWTASALGERVVLMPSETATPPAAPSLPPPSPLPDRTTCEEIKGTDYRSQTEREWYLAHCVPTPAPSRATVMSPQQYRETGAAIVTRVAHANTAIASYLGNPMVSDPAWKAAVITELDVTEGAKQEFSLLTPPQGLEFVHECTLAALSDWVDAGRIFRRYLDDPSQESLLYQAGTLMNTGDSVLRGCMAVMQ